MGTCLITFSLQVVSFYIVCTIKLHLFIFLHSLRLIFDPGAGGLNNEESVGKSREAPRCSDSLLFLPCRSSFGVWLTAVQLSEQLACHSHKEKRLSHRSNTLQSPDHPPSTAKKGTTQTGHSAGQGNTSVPH